MNNISYWELESTKNELKESLDKQKMILSAHIIEYLNSLLELEFSVLKNEINIDEREVLSDYTLYKRIAMYNIYNRALKIISDTNIDFDISDFEVNNRNLELSLREDYNSYFLFKFFCAERASNDSIRSVLLPKPDPIAIGDITLYKLEENDLAIKSRLNEMRYKQEELSKEIFNRGDPNYQDYILFNRKTIDELKKSIEFLEKRLNEGLPLKDRNAIELVNMIHNKLLADYGLSEDDFDKVVRNNSTSKVLVKKYPKLTVSDTRNYI